MISRFRMARFGNSACQPAKSCRYQQPYLDEILQGHKRIENRGGRAPWRYRGRIYLHASGYHPWLPTGQILGSVEIVDSVPAAALQQLALMARDGVPRGQKLQNRLELLQIAFPQVWERLLVWRETDPDVQLRHIHGPFCYLLERPRLLRRPITAQGKLGLWRLPRRV